MWVAAKPLIQGRYFDHGVNMQTERRREALFGYRLRFSPETQPIRQTVLDSIVLQNVMDRPEATIGKILTLRIRTQVDLTISQDEAASSLDRLEAQGFVVSRTVKRKKRWTATEPGRIHVEKRAAQAVEIRDRVASTLFENADNAQPLAEQFFEALGLIFDAITVSYLESMFSDKSSPVTSSVIDRAVKAANGGSPSTRSVLTTAVQRFFKEDTPDFKWLKWTYCKNYYSVRSLGLGAGSDVLSRSLFSGATFYLDTNVILHALEPDSDLNTPIMQVLSGLATIGCKLQVLQITVTELRDLIEKLSANLSVVLKQIPDALLPSVDDLVARVEARHRRDGTQPTPEQLLRDIARAESIIEERLGAGVVSDEWFDEKHECEQIATLSENLRAHYDQMSNHRSKTQAAALHDALALAYVGHVRTTSKQRAYFLTLDRSLPNYQPAVLFEGLRVNGAITPPALMPWLGTIVDDDEGAATALSAALASELLPPVAGYSMQEFRMLAELDMDCRNMPVEDVEQCLLYLRREARGMNMATAEDREKVHALVRGFFSSPDRKYLAEITTLRGSLEDAERDAHDQREERQKQELRADALAQELIRRDVDSRARKRLGWVALLWVALMIAAWFLATRLADGGNAFQQIGNAWWLFVAVSSMCAGLVRFVCRGELWLAVRRMIPGFGG